MARHKFKFVTVNHHMTEEQQLAIANNRIYRRLRNAGLNYDTLENNKVVVILRGSKVLASATYRRFESPAWVKMLSKLADEAISTTKHTKV